MVPHFGKEGPEQEWHFACMRVEAVQHFEPLVVAAQEGPLVAVEIVAFFAEKKVCSLQEAEQRVFVADLERVWG
jgi:hypothetical protein